MTISNQTTIKSAGELVGIGLHSGKTCKVTLLPAEAGGIIFCLKSLNSEVTIPALAKYALLTPYHTCLQKGETTVKTVEHLMSALNAYKIDNLKVELSSDELPILDGSALEWVKLLKNCGEQSLVNKKKFFKIKKKVIVGDSSNFAAFSPISGTSSEQQFDFFIDFSSKVINKQSFSFKLDKLNYEKQIAPSKTFGFEKDIKILEKKNLIQGASFDNVLVISKENTLMNKNKLSFSDEFVRHKVLDAIGDTYLGGAHLLGSYQGYKASHKLNIQLLKKIFKEG